MKKRFLVSVCLFLGLLLVSSVEASELVFQFVNPSFGGNPLSGQFLLNEASAQNKFKEVRPKPSYLEQLKRHFLYRFANELVDKIFGEEEITPGHYQMDNFIVDISQDTQGLTIYVVDISTGGETTIEIPYY